MTDAPHLTDAQLGELADGTAAGAEGERAALHAERCDDCRQALAETRELLRLARLSRGDVRAPAELWPLVAASTIHAGRLRREALRALRVPLLVAALALVAATALVTAAVTRQAMRPPPVAVPEPPTPPKPPAPPPAPAPPAPPAG